MTNSATAERPKAAAVLTACPVCELRGSHRRFAVREMMFATRETFDYLLCPSCGTLRIETVPADLDRHYPARYHYEQLPDDMPAGSVLHRALVGLGVAPDFTGSGRLLARFARRVAPPPPGYRRWRGSFQRWGVRSMRDAVLDVGCGSIPNRLIALRALGPRRMLGIDLFIEGDAVVGGVPLRKARIEDVDERFDLVWFHHSLEHVPDPRGALTAAARLLRPGGRVIVRTPVMGAALWERYESDWWELDAPRHLFVFSAAGLERVARDAGLELEEVIQETGAKEFIGSEQYRRDLAMFEPGSWFVDPAASGFGPPELAAFTEAANRANRDRQAGRACFRFRLLP